MLVPFAVVSDKNGTGKRTSTAVLRMALSKDHDVTVIGGDTWMVNLHFHTGLDDAAVSRSFHRNKTVYARIRHVSHDNNKSKYNFMQRERARLASMRRKRPS